MDLIHFFTFILRGTQNSSKLKEGSSSNTNTGPVDHSDSPLSTYLPILQPLSGRLHPAERDKAHEMLLTFL